MDIRKVKKLIELLQTSGIAEIEVCEGEESVRISAHSQHAGQLHPPPTMVPPTVMGQSGEPSVPSATTLPQEDDSHVVTSPMVGIFYTSPAPDQPPFVTIGQSVKRGDVLCVIEAMKIMNQIEADTDGVIKKIFVESGEPVEYGQSLFRLG